MVNSSLYFLVDHLHGFTPDGKNEILDQVPLWSTVHTEYVLPEEIKQLYPVLKLKFSAWLYLIGNHIYPITIQATKIEHKPLSFKNFACSFNRRDQLGRHFLLAELYNRGWFTPEYCSKHFDLNTTWLMDAGIQDIPPPDFVCRTVTFDYENALDHTHNLQVLSPLIQDNFLTIVSESLSAMSKPPFPTEKFLYPIANRRLWVAFAQPGYHAHIKNLFRFEPYSCFDYSFDSIEDPVARLKAMTSMLEPFAHMTETQWLDIYEQQQPVIERNFRHLADFTFFDMITDLDECTVAFDKVSSVFGPRLIYDEFDRFMTRKQKTGKLIIPPGKTKDQIFNQMVSDLKRTTKK